MWNIGSEGWKALAEAVQQPAFGFFTSVVFITKRAFGGGRREDIKKVFHTIPPGTWWWMRSDNPLYRHKKEMDFRTVEAKWTRLLKILDTSMEDWAAEPLLLQKESDMEKLNNLEEETQEQKVARVDEQGEEEKGGTK